MAGLKYWLWLSTRKGLGALGALRLLDRFQGPEQVYFARSEEYDLVDGLSRQGRLELKNKSMDGVQQILADCDRLGIRILTMQDAHYPERLRQLPDAPIVLYVKGRLPVFDEEVAIGVVGTREPSLYGLEMASKLGYELARGGALVVSGIARGLDTAALKGALKAGGNVVSVLGGGIDVYYPRENRWLYEDVAAAGALISEYPPGTENAGAHFPVRNRIISGLSLGVVAVECRERSGTMSTMNRALDQDRDLFAVPGAANLTMSEGTNLLIQQGAKLVTCGADILSEYRERFPVKLSEHPREDEVQAQRLEGIPEQEQLRQPEKPQSPAPAANDGREVLGRKEARERFTDDQITILMALEEKSCGTEELVERTQIPVRRVTTALTMLQIDGAVEEGTGRRFTTCVRIKL